MNVMNRMSKNLNFVMNNKSPIFAYIKHMINVLESEIVLVKTFNHKHGLLGKSVDIDLEVDMIEEELDEFLSASNKVDMLDAYVDIIYVLCGSILKIQNDTMLSLPEKFNHLQIIYSKYEVADSIKDLMLIEHGINYIHIYKAFEIVHKANMTKPVCPDNSGKVQKGEDFVHPDLSKVFKI